MWTEEGDDCDPRSFEIKLLREIVIAFLLNCMS